jgi:hypothetical protein
MTLSELSQAAHKLAKEYYEKDDKTAVNELGKIEDEVDKNCAGLYGISNEELEEIKKTLQILREGGVIAADAEEGSSEESSDD